MINLFGEYFISLIQKKNNLLLENNILNKDLI